MITIPNAIYRKFYEILKAVFIQRIHSVMEDFSTENDYTIWFTVNKNSSRRETFFSEYFKGVTSDPRHYYLRFIKAEKNSNFDPAEKENILIDTFEKFFKLTSPSQIHWPDIKKITGKEEKEYFRKKASVLLQVFFESYSPEMFFLYPFLKVFDRITGLFISIDNDPVPVLLNTNRSIESRNNDVYQKLTIEKKSLGSDNPSFGDYERNKSRVLEENDINFERAFYANAKLIRSYYDFLMADQFADAWALWSVEKMAKFSADYFRQILHRKYGYRRISTNQTTRIQITNFDLQVELGSNKVRALFYIHFQEDINLPLPKGYDDFQDYRLEHLKRFYKEATALREKSKKMGVDISWVKISDIRTINTVIKFFTSDDEVYLKDLTDVFTEVGYFKTNRTLFVRTDFLNGNWKIGAVFSQKENDLMGRIYSFS